MFWILLLVGVFLLLLNAFFVLVEYALVQMRASRVEELIDQGHPRAMVVKHIQAHLDEYLSVCQFGITCASIGLGFVGAPAFIKLLEPALQWTGAGTALAHTIAITVGYFVVCFLHIWLGEQVPKILAIRRADAMSLSTARPMVLFHKVFYLPLLLLNRLTNLVLRLVGAQQAGEDPHHTEDELKIILQQSQSRGLMSFRRLLLVENVFDLGDLKVRDAMKAQHGVKTVLEGVSWEENLARIRESRYSRYPMIDSAGEPVGIIHVKDLLYGNNEEIAEEDVKKLIRPFATTYEDTPLETLLAELQGMRRHVAIVRNQDGKWTGFISLEDIIEEIVGAIEDEFEVEPPLFLADSLSENRVVLGVDADSILKAIEKIIAKVPREELPFAAEKVQKAVEERERLMSTYLGRGLAVPHARLEGLKKPVLIFARSDGGIPIEGWKEKAHLLFMLLTPAENPRIQARLLARIGGLMDSEFVVERLEESDSPRDILDAIKAGDPVSLG
ncbi:MAG: CNNM domain-containing protein [Planctomycetota bacterium]|jgi:CBS domain containing-hemolysin-like protein|nr:CNNM domain-containing protein [Planctomycetota bacterium]